MSSYLEAERGREGERDRGGERRKEKKKREEGGGEGRREGEREEDGGGESEGREKGREGEDALRDFKSYTTTKRYTVFIKMRCFSLRIFYILLIIKTEIKCKNANCINNKFQDANNV